MGFDSLFDEIEPTGFELHSMALSHSLGTGIEVCTVNKTQQSHSTSIYSTQNRS